MYRAEALTPWTGSGERHDPHRPLLPTAHAVTWNDVTGQSLAAGRPDPDLVAILVTCDEATLDAIEADQDYEVLWSEEIEDAA